ncbi:Lp29 family lipoprotein [Leptospira yasudae]|uniref:Lp29 family lipoprotein n=1 Tax=Leptospira yasudae TaxID=2202201 RepID=UPI0038507ECF
MIRNVIIVLQLILVTNCIRYYVRPLKESAETNLSIKTDPNKVALVGFYPFKSQYIGSTGRTMHYAALLNYEHDFKFSLKNIGTPIEKIPEAGLNSSVSKKNANEFCSNYLQLVKASGIDEISKAVKIKVTGEGDQTKYECELKRRDVKYYIVGVFGPPFTTGGPLALAKGIPTFFLGAFSLFTIPWWTEGQTELTIFVYDEKLNLLKKWEDTSLYNMTVAWWNPDLGEGNLFGATEEENRKSVANRIRLYEPMLIEFEREFHSIINPNK